MNRLQWIKLLIENEIHELKWTYYNKHPEKCKHPEKWIDAIIVEETEDSSK